MLSQELRAATIVIIDDIGTNIRLLESSLKAFGLRYIHSFSDPVAGLDWLQNNHWDLLLLDLDMPRMDGFELLARLAPNSGQPVIILTALGSQVDRQRGLHLGANDYLCKPLDLSELLLRIRNNLQLGLTFQKLQEERDTLDQKVLERTRELQASFTSLIHTMARAAAFKDTETGNHIIRIGEMAALIARELGQPDTWVEDIRLAAPMHDVGKIGIPDVVLNKNGKLTPEERELMKTHARIGFDILRNENNSAMINMAAEIALNHHEYWDGSGYPQGLSGEAIPLSARIVALCDVYDALRAKRPYKTAWTDSEALNHIVQGAGSHFDPMLVELFSRLHDSLEQIIAQYQEQSEPLLKRCGLN